MEHDFGKPICGDLDVACYWRVAQYNIKSFDAKKYCQCWFDKSPNIVDVFCNPKGGCKKLENGRPPLNVMDSVINKLEC
jgi:hypothetical protein